MSWFFDIIDISETTFSAIDPLSSLAVIAALVIVFWITENQPLA